MKDKERANFCDYFKPRDDAYAARNIDATAKAQAELDALFGGSKQSDATAQPSAADKARAELEALFGKK